MFYRCNFTKCFLYEGEHITLGILCCIHGDAEVGLLVLQALSVEQAANMSTENNFNMMHMQSRPNVKVHLGAGMYSDPAHSERQQTRYFEYAVNILGLHIDSAMWCGAFSYQPRFKNPCPRLPEITPGRRECEGCTALMYAIFSAISGWQAFWASWALIGTLSEMVLATLLMRCL